MQASERHFAIRSPNARPIQSACTRRVTGARTRISTKTQGFPPRRGQKERENTDEHSHRHKTEVRSAWPMSHANAFVAACTPAMAQTTFRPSTILYGQMSTTPHTPIWPHRDSERTCYFFVGGFGKRVTTKPRGGTENGQIVKCLIRKTIRLKKE